MMKCQKSVVPRSIFNMFQNDFQNISTVLVKMRQRVFHCLLETILRSKDYNSRTVLNVKNMFMSISYRT